MKLYEIEYCDNRYCIYCNSNKCILDGIGIDSGGQCDSCIMVDIHRKKLERLKEEHLKKIMMRH